MFLRRRGNSDFQIVKMRHSRAACAHDRSPLYRVCKRLWHRQFFVPLNCKITALIIINKDHSKHFHISVGREEKWNRGAFSGLLPEITFHSLAVDKLKEIIYLKNNIIRETAC